MENDELLERQKAFFDKIKICNNSNLWGEDFWDEDTPYESVEPFEKKMDKILDDLMEKALEEAFGKKKPPPKIVKQETTSFVYADSYDRCIYIPKRERHPNLENVLGNLLRELDANENFYDIRKECQKNTKVKCKTKSLCAAVAWRDYAKDLMSLSEFHKKTGVTETTLKRTMKKLEPN